MNELEMDSFINTLSVKKISEKQKNDLSAPITIDEISLALKKMSNDSHQA